MNPAKRRYCGSGLIGLLGIALILLRTLRPEQITTAMDTLTTPQART